MNQEPDKKQSEEELEELREVIKKIEELQKQKDKKPQKPRRRFIAIEFGGVFHHNRIINFLFGFILNFTFIFFIIELFEFATYRDILYMVYFVLAYSILEEIFRSYVLYKLFPLVLRSFGTVFFFGYLLIFFILDQYIFVRDFNFVNASLLVLFVIVFTILRYLFSMLLRQYFRRRNVR